MALKFSLRHGWAGIALGIALCGCLPSSRGSLDEQKEPHFLTGKALVNALDPKGAIDAFEKALEANPQNGSAHFELGLLYEKEADYSAAIYHFERFLRMRPDSDYAQVVKERINADKMELSKTAAFAPVTQNLQREFDKEMARLVEENKQLRAEVEKWRAYYASQQSSPGTQAGNNPRPNGANESVSQGAGAVAVAGTGSAAGVRTAMRTHSVKGGETPVAIARKYGVKLELLMAANPGLDPRRMKVGQVLNIPAP
jgi:tetratricopeptide (TPR) repeat protein